MGRMPEKRMSPCSSPIVFRPAIRSSSVDLPASAGRRCWGQAQGHVHLLCSLPNHPVSATKSHSTHLSLASLISPEQNSWAAVRADALAD